MDFAKKLMEKYGWKEGDGLGKNSDGIVKPVKASLKFDATGLGCDKAKEFNNHWWERVFNEAANNVEVDKTDGNVALNIKDEDSVEITTKEYSVRKLKKIKGNEAYDNFMKHSTLTNTGNEEEIEGTIHDEDIKIKTKVVQLTDEELFAACGGRTAHKGARHGHTMKSKISRLEAQEQALMEQMLKSKQDLEEKDRNGFIKRKEKILKAEIQEETEEPPKKKKKSKNCDQEENVEDSIVKKKKKSKNQDSEDIVEEVASTNLEEKDSSKKHKKSKKNKECTNNVEDNSSEEVCIKKNKKSKKSKEVVDESEKLSKPKKKKNKNKDD